MQVFFVFFFIFLQTPINIGVYNLKKKYKKIYYNWKITKKCLLFININIT